MEIERDFPKLDNKRRLEMRYAPDILPVCTECESSENFSLLTKNCERCKVMYCPHFASKVDDNYCGNCMIDVQLEVYQRRDYKNIKINGSDFFFAQQTVHELSDTQLEIKIEYFDAMLTALRLEKEERKVERLGRLAKTKIMAIRPAPATQATPKTKTTKGGGMDVMAALTILFGRTPSPAEIAAFMQAAKK